jgi:hypothetical protein
MSYNKTMKACSRRKNTKSCQNKLLLITFVIMATTKPNLAQGIYAVASQGGVKWGRKPRAPQNLLGVGIGIGAPIGAKIAVLPQAPSEIVTALHL